MKAERVIGKRTLIRMDTGEPVHLLLGKPRRDRRGRWRCDFEVRGVGGRFEGLKTTEGIDSLQALQVALAGLRAALRFSGVDIRLTADGQPGQWLLPGTIPEYLGPSFEEHVEKLATRAARKGRKKAR